jgi:hypothetical protein
MIDVSTLILQIARHPHPGRPTPGVLAANFDHLAGDEFNPEAVMPSPARRARTDSTPEPTVYRGIIDIYCQDNQLQQLSKSVRKGVIV